MPQAEWPYSCWRSVLDCWLLMASAYCSYGPVVGGRREGRYGEEWTE